MNLDVLVPLAWTCWAIVFGALLVVTLLTPRDSQPSPDGARGFGCVFIPIMYILVLGAGGLLFAFMKSQSQVGVFAMAIVLAFPVIMMVVVPGVKAYERWRFEREYARVGQFKEAALRPFAEAIRSGDWGALTRLLGGKPPPAGLDRAGHDVLGYALAALRGRRGSLDCVRVLLEAGCDPNTARMPDGLAPIHFMIVDSTPAGRRAVHLLLEHGADPNAVDPITGDTPLRGSGDSPDLVRALVEAGAEMDRIQSNGVTALVSFVARWHWESARFLVERGARLDVANEDGLSLDYYLEDWKDSVFGEHPEGWDRLRAAVAARGKPLP